VFKTKYFIQYVTIALTSVHVCEPRTYYKRVNLVGTWIWCKR